MNLLGFLAGVRACDPFAKDYPLIIITYLHLGTTDVTLRRTDLSLNPASATA